MTPYLRGRALLVLAILGTCSGFFCLAQNEDRSLAEKSIPLRQDWAIQSGCKIQAGGAQLSSTQYHPDGWIHATVPTTVLAAQVAAGIYKDPYYGMNLRKIPGMDYPIGEGFANMEMSAGSPYRCAWWYRKQFQVPFTSRGKTTWLHFGGINYRANIWINGHLVADSKQIAGTFRVYNLDITKAVTPGKTAVIAVEVFAPGPHDLGINWVDWNPAPPDKDMGLWGPVDLVTTGPVAVRSPFIATHFEDASLQVADITVTAQLKNAMDHPVDGILSGTFAGRKFQQPVQLAANESRSVSFSPEKFPQLKLHHPAIWWPVEMGAHPLENLTVRFLVDHRVSDTTSARVGIRDVTSELNVKGFRMFRINGKPILIRGGGWAPDMMLREDHENLAEQIRMVKDMHLNAIRQEGKMEGDEFYRLTDENGILVMAGWCCCDVWEEWPSWTPEDHQVAYASLRSQMLRLRHHASLFVWANGSDRHPTVEVERKYLEIEKETQWPNAILSSVNSKYSRVTGLSGVKEGPYDYVSPSYWYIDTERGGAFGFDTETSAGPDIPQPDSLERFLPPQDRWPINKVWDYHAGGGGYTNLDKFNTAMRETYGWPDSMDEYSRIAQTMSYDSDRAIFEAYTRNKYTSTGVIHWMLGNAWPSVIWHLYDYYLQTGGGYFGTKKACEPLHVQYSYDDHSIYAVSSLPVATPSLTVRADVFDYRLKPIFHQAKTINLAADGSEHVLDIPSNIFQSEQSIHFVQLEMKDASGKIISQNFYWIPSKLTQFDWKNAGNEYTPAVAYAKLQALQSLPKSQIRGTLTITNHALHIHLENPSNALAFQVQLRGFTTDDKPIIPLLWSDDFVELMPGEHRDITAALPAHTDGNRAMILVSGWNTNTLKLRPPHDF